MRRNDVRLRIIREAIEGLIPRSTPAFLSVQLTEKVPLARRASVHTWTGTPAGLAERVYTALYGRPDSSAELLSPLAQSDAAHARRDAGAMVDVLTHADHQLTHAPWYPARPGDLVHVHYEQSGETAAFGETYVVGDAGDGLMSLLLLAHTNPLNDLIEEMTVGALAVDAADCPVYGLWFEAGPHRLTLVRDGRVVHGGGAK